MTPSAGSTRVFITGGAGFIGANLVDYILERHGFCLRIYDNLSACSRANLDAVVRRHGADGRVQCVEGDICDFERLCDAMTGHEAVVHLAAHTQVRQSIVDPRPHVAVNAEGTFNVIEAARRTGARVFVFASSNAAVGAQKPPINETMVPRPMSPYGAVKLYGEALCSAYYHSYGLNTVALRFANAYGPFSGHKTSVVAKFLRKRRSGEALEIYGDGGQSRDFVHAGDIAQAICRVITCGPEATGLWGEIFQIATGRETRIVDLAREICRLTDGSEEALTFGEAMQGEICQNFSDIGKAGAILGFAPEVDLGVGLSTMWTEESTRP
ncbi:MAG: NAD-dependent epimerase/dehydratase family protein [Phycisphaerae bacterium]|nr:NAD-dependent epimerase/dehydratase family protein [Phycisphaerae bacterium]